MTPWPLPNWLVAAIDLELVRLHGNLILPRWSYLIGLDKLDVGIGVIDPDRGCAPVSACLFDPQRRLVVFRVGGSHLQNGRGRGKLTFV
jgi:hypothetical protein